MRLSRSHRLCRNALAIGLFAIAVAHIHPAKSNYALIMAPNVPPCAPPNFNFASLPNFLKNPSLEAAGPNGASTTITTNVPGGAGNSAAANWTLFTNVV